MAAGIAPDAIFENFFEIGGAFGKWFPGKRFDIPCFLRSKSTLPQEDGCISAAKIPVFLVWVVLTILISVFYCSVGHVSEGFDWTL